MKKIITILAILLATGNSNAGEVGQWYVQAGVAHQNTNEEISFSGFSLPFVEAETQNPTTVGLGVGYFFDEHWSASFLGVLPTETEIKGTGILTGLYAGKFTSVPLHGFLNYHFVTEGSFQPFIGAGFVYNHISSVEDGILVDFDVDSKVGPAFRAGFDYMVDENWGMFASVNKAFVNHDITGNFIDGTDVIAIMAQTDLDPWVFQGGVTFRF